MTSTAVPAIASAEAVWTLVDSPIGELLLAAEHGGLSAVFFQGHKDGHDERPQVIRLGRRDDEDPLLRRAAGQLAEYFAQERREFDLPLHMNGSRFAQRVWTALLDIPYGQTCSYGDIAKRLGLLPSASRAIGMANGANPISIVVPCHRVIGADGSLTGYGGGLENKRFLLDLERDLLF